MVWFLLVYQYHLSAVCKKSGFKPVVQYPRGPDLPPVKPDLVIAPGPVSFYGADGPSGHIVYAQRTPALFRQPQADHRALVKGIGIILV